MTSVIDQNITEHALLREKPRERFNLLFRRLADDVLLDNCTLTRKNSTAQNLKLIMLIRKLS